MFCIVSRLVWDRQSVIDGRLRLSKLLLLMIVIHSSEVEQYLQPWTEEERLHCDMTLTSYRNTIMKDCETPLVSPVVVIHVYYSTSL